MHADCTCTRRSAHLHTRSHQLKWHSSLQHNPAGTSAKLTSGLRLSSFCASPSSGASSGSPTASGSSAATASKACMRNIPSASALNSCGNPGAAAAAFAAACIAGTCPAHIACNSTRTCLQHCNQQYNWISLGSHVAARWANTSLQHPCADWKGNCRCNHGVQLLTLRAHLTWVLLPKSRSWLLPLIVAQTGARPRQQSEMH